MAAYTASKAGVEAFADSLRAELAHTGTAVGCAYFGFIDTDMVRRSFERRSAQMSQERGAVRFGKWASVESAGAAVVRGIENRARKVYAPRWVLPMLYLRTLVQPLAEASARRQHVEEIIAIAEREPSQLTTPQPR
ncbi:MAG TPA: SDR family NAD(P)-dependent oxidoreductase, partial [Solirubrobacteraceae bacterium]